ncbi:hypothetical protein ALI22I_33460 [Saccharothrix sp. ALI-22-I]|nr:hypothetical protein ALI22I_33460 [Saccharothrix sp. ALI-22-I]
MELEMSDTGRTEHTVQITIDGRPFQVEPGHHLTAAVLLELAGLDPSGYDLAEIRGQGEIVKFEDAEIVTVRPRKKFVSIRQVAPVA